MSGVRPSRRAGAVAAFVVLVLVAGVLQAVREPRLGTPRDDPRVSALSTAPRGARAMFLWLRELGYDPRLWKTPLTALDATASVLFVLEPSQEPTPAERERLLEWVAGGGTLFLATGYDPAWIEELERWVELDTDQSAPSDVRGDRVVPDSGDRWRYRRLGPRERGQYLYPVEEIAFRGETRVRDAAGENPLLLGRDGLGIAAEIYHGDGMMIVFPEADVFTNRGIAKADNAEFIASLVADWVEPGAVVWFDEYDHGARVAGSLPVYLLGRRPALFALAILTVGALALLRYGRALRIRPSAAGARRRPNEFVDALGGLYRHARAVEPAHAALADAAVRVARSDLAGLRPAAWEPEERDERAARVERLAAVRSPKETDLVQLAAAVAGLLRTSEPERRER